MNHEAYEQEIEEIDFLELFFTVIRKWKSILLTAVVFAVLLGGFKGIAVLRTGSTATEEQLAQIEACRSNVESLQNSINSEQAYMGNSIWYRLNAGNTVSCKTAYYITIDNADLENWIGSNDAYADAILRSYQEIMTGNTLLTELAEQEGIDVSYIREIIAVATSENADDAGRFLTVTVYHDSAENAQRVMDELTGKMDTVTQQVTEAVGPHDIKVVEEGIGNLISPEQLNNQTLHNNSLTTLQTELQTRQAELEQLESQCKTENIGKAIAKFGIIGALLGIVLALVLIIVAFILSDKLNRAEELKRRYHATVLGRLETKKPNGLADRLIARLAGKDQKIDSETALDIIAGNLANYAANERKILITGLANREVMENVAGEMKKRLPEKQILCSGDVSTDINTLKILPYCDGIVLVEECGVSEHPAIEVEMDHIQNLKKKLIGCIVLE